MTALPKRVPVSRVTFSLTDRAAFEQATALATEWLRETAKIVNFPDAARKRESFEFSSDQADGCAIRADDDQGVVWAARLNLIENKFNNRKWITELFVEQRKGGLTRFGVQLTCEIGSSTNGFDHSRPRFVQEILSKLAAEVDGEAISETVEEVGIEETSGLYDLIYRADRRLPIVVVSVAESGDPVIGLGHLARRLSGTAHLRWLKSDAMLAFNKQASREMALRPSSARLYMPNPRPGSEDTFRHPVWLWEGNSSNKVLVNLLASRILPLGFRDPEGDARFWRVSLLRQAASQALALEAVGSTEQKLAAQVQALVDKNSSLQETAAAAESLMEEANNRLTSAEIELEKYKDQVFVLSSKIEAIEFNAPSISNTTLNDEDIHSLFEQSPSLLSSLRIISAIFPDRIVVLPSAYDAASRSEDFKHKKKAFVLLWKLATDYWSVLSAGDGDNSARQCFGNAYAAKEAESLSAEGKKRRTFTYNGETMEMYRHLKIGIKDNLSDTLRVHFEWVGVDKRIVIGHCGGHLNF